jgi:hypothetical protein
VQSAKRKLSVLLVHRAANDLFVPLVKLSLLHSVRSNFNSTTGIIE